MKARPYDQEKDFEPIGDFLIETYIPGEKYTNWLQPRWEYMHFHPSIREIDLSKIGVFEEDDQIIAVVHMEANERTAYFQIRPGFEHIKLEMFEYAENNFQGISQSTGKLIRALYIHEDDDALLELARSGGYERWRDFDEPNSFFDLSQPFHPAPLPDGYRLQSLAEEDDFYKINQVLWRGFNHPGPPPDEEIEGRQFAQQAPNFNKDLTIVAVAPDGRYVSFCGMWVVPENRLAYVEPVATDPDFRRMGLGRAAVLESLCRAKALGAEIAWVGSDLEFYKAMGFQTTFKYQSWVKTLE